MGKETIVMNDKTLSGFADSNMRISQMLPVLDSIMIDYDLSMEEMRTALGLYLERMDSKCQEG